MKLIDALELALEINGLANFEGEDGKPKKKVVKITGLLNEELSFTVKRKLRKISNLLKEEQEFHESERKKIFDNFKNTETGKLEGDNEKLAQEEYEKLLETEIDITIEKIKAEDMSFKSKYPYPLADQFLIED